MVSTQWPTGPPANLTHRSLSPLTFGFFSLNLAVDVSKVMSPHLCWPLIRILAIPIQHLLSSYTSCTIHLLPTPLKIQPTLPRLWRYWTAQKVNVKHQLPFRQNWYCRTGFKKKIFKNGVLSWRLTILHTLLRRCKNHRLNEQILPVVVWSIRVLLKLHAMFDLDDHETLDEWDAHVVSIPIPLLFLVTQCVRLTVCVLLSVVIFQLASGQWSSDFGFLTRITDYRFW